MATGEPKTFEVTCPCCHARLAIDPEVRAVVHHALPPRSGPLGNLDQALGAVKGAEARRDAAFRQATESERTRGDVLSRKFKAGLEHAKDTPDPPPRPFDYD